MCKCQRGANISNTNGTYKVTCKKCGAVYYNGNCKNSANMVHTMAMGMTKSSTYKPRGKGKPKANPLFECKCKRFYSRLKVDGTVVCVCNRKSCNKTLYVAPNYMAFVKWASLEGKVEVYPEDNRAVPNGGLNRR